MKLIENLLRMLFPPRVTQSHIDTLTLESLGTFVEPTSFICNDVEITSLLPYRNKVVRALIVEAKFHEHAQAHTILGTLLAEYVGSLSQEMCFDSGSLVVVPIPLSTQRLRERGYNQTQKIVSVALLQCPSTTSRDVLLRTRDTIPQMTLGRSARLRNMEHVFALRESLNPESVYVLVDDVATTGATLSSAAQVLLQNGAKHLHVVALAH